MRMFVRRLTAAIAVAFLSMAAAVLVTPGISSAQCVNNMSFNPATLECKQPTAPSAWYTPPPSYAPSFAGPDVPPPPPPPWWAGWQAPMWSTGFHQWGIYLGGAWVPL
ncbi:hypothetical protein ACTXG5_10280 [Mycobacterium sp. Dal123C01]|uniref:hypothetical protein n=1 Tax=Mycobacterium sp. Dal123C01 TaxID=3457577 RepID=UPI00403E5AA4